MRIIFKKVFSIAAFVLMAAGSVYADDIDGVTEHALITRYPGQDIRWQHIENYMPYRVPTGPVVGYGEIDDWIDTQGRVTRTFYKYEATDRTFSEIYKNYLDALTAENFEILGQGFSDTRRGVEVGSRKWSNVLFKENPTTKPGEVGTMFAGTSSSGGAGSIVATKERAAGTVYAIINVEQHADNYVGTLIDIIEVAVAETGLVSVDAEAIGSDIEEYGRVVLDGILFEFDQAVLKAESKPALSAIATYLADHKDKNFYVVGHTDSVGTFSYNSKLSSARALAVVKALTSDYGIATGRLEPHGIGPLVPIFSNGTDAGRERNRRVELVERRGKE